jgi:hypothetical protein
MPIHVLRHIVTARSFIANLPKRAVKLLLEGDFRALELMYALVFISGASTKIDIVNDAMSFPVKLFFYISAPFDVLAWFGVSASAIWARHKDDNLRWRRTFGFMGFACSLWSLSTYFVAWQSGYLQMEQAMFNDQMKDIVLMIISGGLNIVNIGGIMGRVEGGCDGRI